MNKNRIYKILGIIAVFAIWRLIVANNTTQPDAIDVPEIHLTGTTMGPIPYSIKYMDDKGRDFQKEIDALLNAFNNSLSTYIPSSEISRFNTNNSFEFETDFFYPVLLTSKEVFEKTGGAFDPTIGPLVNAWGFGPEKSQGPDSLQVDSLLNIIGFDKVVFDKNMAEKQPDMYLDLSAVAKGNGIDVVAEFLQGKGIANYMVEIGGEVVCRGNSKAARPWVIGVQKPAMKGGQSELMAKISMKDIAIATSGNYRNYYIKDGKMIAHTISPFTGYPESSNLLSASVFAENCTLADAYATACMVLGLEKSKKLIAEIDGLECFFIYTDENGDYQTYSSEGIAPHIEVVE